MTTDHSAPFGPPARPQPPDIRRQLERMLADPLFQASRRLSRFLQFVVEQDLVGHSTELKEHTIGLEVFDRGAAYSPQQDPIVRIMAGRLRSRLAEYYGDRGRADSVLIDLPRGGYVPQYQWRARPPVPPVSGDAAPGSPGHIPPVGREAELRQLQSLHAAAVGGSGSVVFISGEAGLGKTTVVEEFLDRIGNPPGTVWIGRGRGSERLAETDAFVPVYECLDLLAQGQDGSQLMQVMQSTAPGWYARIAPGADEARVTSQERLRREFVQLFEKLAQIRPVVLFFDDLHWADVSTCDLLAYLGTRIQTMRILILMAYRTAEVQRAQHPFLSLRISLDRAGTAQELPLALLTLDHTAQYLALHFPQNRFPDAFAALLQERTEGNPLFLTDLLRYLRDRRKLLEQDGHWQLERPLEELRQVIPSGVSNMIRVKLDQFTEADRHLLLCAAAQGMEFDSAVISQVLDRDAADVEERLRELAVVQGYLDLVGEPEFPNQTFSVRYRFVHVFYLDALLAMLAPTRRAAYSLSIGRTLVSLLGAASRGVAAKLALLFEAGRDPAAAAEYFLHAARHAARVFAYTEAAILCRRGLRALLSLPESRERDTHELKFTLILGLALMATQGYAAPDVERTNLRSRELCLRLGERRRLVSVLWGLHTCYINGGDLARSLDIAQEMRSLAEEQGDPLQVVESLHALGTSLGFIGRLTEARDTLHQIFTRFPAAGHVFRESLYVMDPYVTSLSMLARLLASLGACEEAVRKAEEAVELATRLAHPPSLAYAMLWVGWVAHAIGDYAASCGPLEQVMEWSREHDLPLLLEWGRVVRGSALVHLGRGAEGIAEMRQSLASQQALHSLLDRPYCLTHLAEGLLHAGGPAAEALALCNEALSFAGQTGCLWYQAETLRIRGEIRLQDGAAAASVREDFLAAMSLARQGQSALLELRAAISDCTLQRRLGQAEAGRAVLSEALQRVRGNVPVVIHAAQALQVGDRV